MSVDFGLNHSQAAPKRELTPVMLDEPAWADDPGIESETTYAAHQPSGVSLNRADGAPDP